MVNYEGVRYKYEKEGYRDGHINTSEDYGEAEIGNRIIPGGNYFPREGNPGENFCREPPTSSTLWVESSAHHRSAAPPTDKGEEISGGKE